MLSKEIQDMAMLRRVILSAIATCAFGVVSLLVAGTAAAALTITDVDGELYNVDGAGNPVAATQAGSHPDYAKMRFEFAIQSGPGPSPMFPFDYPTESVKDLKIKLPAGLIGNPEAMPKCRDRELGLNACPNNTQVGYTTLKFAGFAGVGTLTPTGVYNMVPSHPSSPARFGFNVGPTGPIYINASLRSDGDYGVDIDVTDASQGAGLISSDTVLWGVPADPMHDPDRGTTTGRPPGESGTFCFLEPNPATCSNTSGMPEVPLLTLPTSCTGPVRTSLIVDSWQDPAPNGEREASFLSHAAGDRDTLVGTEGCENVPFAPTFEIAPHSPEPGAPSGYTIDLRVPQPMTPKGIESSHLRQAVVTMPEGVRMNPSAAGGLEACSDAQVGIGSKAPATCPPASTIGTVVVSTPVLEKPLDGKVYLGTQVPGDPYRVFFVIEGQGIIVKLKGSVTPDPVTGRITATFNDNPQVPFDHMRVVFKGGSRAPLANPTECGTHTLTSKMTPWSSGAAATPAASFEIACPGESTDFAPTFEAGSINPIAGIFSPFVARITRNGGKDLGRVNVKLPKGALASLRGVSVCTVAQLESATSKTGRLTQTSPACPAGSQVGSVTVGAGAGATPFYPALPSSTASGRVFLSEPHVSTRYLLPGAAQAAYGLAIEVPAVAGPFDLGTVMVRAAIYVDPTTAQIAVLSDPMPYILEGVPLNVRDIRVQIDRPNFATTPTSCGAKRVAGDIRAQDNTAKLIASRYRVSGCTDLPFEPRLGLRLVGKRQRTTGKHPSIRAVVRQSGLGESAVRQARVVLPRSLALDPENAQALCEFEDGTKPDLEKRCPRGSIVGRARAVSPLLKRPLVGDVYFVKNVRRDPKTGNAIRTLPMIVVALRGEAAVNLVGESSTAKDGRLVNTFAGVPDAPISRFNLNIAGGRNGIIAVTATRRGNIDLCRGRHVSVTRWIGQNGERRPLNVGVRTPCARATAKR